MTPLDILSFAAILYIVILFFFIKSRHFRGTLGIVILSFYSLIAVGCRFFAGQNYYFISHLLLWPFLYYIVVSVIMSYPLLAHHNMMSKFKLSNYTRLNLMCDIYIIISILYVIITFTATMKALQSGAWNSVYLSTRAEGHVIYTSFYERIVMNLVAYFKMPVLLYTFYIFAKGIDYKRKWWTLLIPFINTVFYAMFTASRTSLFIIVLLYLSCYLIYRKELPTSFKKIVRVNFMIIAGISISLVLGITVSRFGEGEYDWLANYFGNSFKVGHDMIGFTDRYSYGTHFAGKILEEFHIKTIPYHCAIDNDVSFHPLIGMRYADFGLFGTILYALFCAFFFSLIFKKRILKLGDVYLIFFYFEDLLMGCLYDNTIATNWVIALCVWVLLNRISMKGSNYTTTKQSDFYTDNLLLKKNK